MGSFLFCISGKITEFVPHPVFPDAADHVVSVDHEGLIDLAGSHDPVFIEDQVVLQ
jgi:hypothetical protein